MMAKRKFDKVNNDVIKEVAKASKSKANVIQVKMIDTNDLIDYPKNNEDCSFTADIEKSIDEQGFTDPIEVTTFGMEEGKFLIIAGHRRRQAGLKKGMTIFPCLIRQFNSDQEVNNAVLFANSHRDSSKDPLLYCNRYKMHEEYLLESGFTGSFREEIANRLGISTQQADRYNQFSKLITPFWDMVRSGDVGMSNILPIATHSLDEQEELYFLLSNYHTHDNVTLTRDFCNKVIKEYRESKNSNTENTADPEIKDSGMPINAHINTEPSETRDSQKNRNNEMRSDYDPHKYDDYDPLAEERLTQEDYDAINTLTKIDDNKSKESKPPLSEDELKSKQGSIIEKNLLSLEKCFKDYYSFENSDKAEKVMSLMCSVSKIIFEELKEISHDYSKADTFSKLVDDLNKSLNDLNK